MTKKFATLCILVLCTTYDDPVAWLIFQTRFAALTVHELARLAPDIEYSFFITNYVDERNTLAAAEQAGLLDYYARQVKE